MASFTSFSGAVERMVGGAIWSKGWQLEYVALPCDGPAIAGQQKFLDSWSRFSNSNYDQ